MKRIRAKARKDKRIFNRTASKVKVVNLPQTIFRGGFRF